MRQCPDTRCGAVLNIPASNVQVWCWRDGGGRWFRVNYGATRGWVSASSMYRQPTVPYCSDMQPGETLWAGQDVWSSDGRYKLSMQTDGNFVEYGPSGAIWSTRTYGSGNNDRAVMQGDGNFVVYNPANAPLYHTGTYNNPGTYLIVQNDGNVVLYGSGYALFATLWHVNRGNSTAGGNAASYGWCTWYAYQRFHDDTGIWPYFAGDAGAWNDYAQTHGWRVQSQPAAHSIVVFEPSGPGSVGHVAWVTAAWPVAGGWKVQVDEMNYDGSATVATGHTRSYTYNGGSNMSYIMAPEI